MIMLGVRSLDRAVAFYEQKLGLSLKQRIPGFAFLDGGAITIVLSEQLAKNASTIAGATEVIFTVDDVRTSCDALKAIGVDFVGEPHGVSGPMWAANFRDPDGHLLTLFGPERAAS
jgi:catechol 2,3-dioxygenase-like lactoylglutathione lyase family enzyme